MCLYIRLLVVNVDNVQLLKVHVMEHADLVIID
jgi:hypothetical protein